MVLPVYQKYGYGRFLIEFSYLLSKKEQMAGTPEKPLSDLGRLSYESFWKFKILEYINQHKNDKITIDEISRSTGMNFVDIAATLQKNDLLKYRQDKGGQPKYEIVMNEEIWRNLKQPKLIVNEDALRWTPLVFISNQSANESMENEINNENLNEEIDLDSAKLISGPIQSNSLNGNLDSDLNKNKKKRRRKWNKTGYDQPPKTRKRKPMTNGTNSKSNGTNGNLVNEDTNNSNNSNKSKQDEDLSSTEEDDRDYSNLNDSDDTLINRSLLEDSSQNYFDCKLSQDSDKL